MELRLENELVHSFARTEIKSNRANTNFRLIEKKAFTSILKCGAEINKALKGRGRIGRQSILFSSIALRNIDKINMASWMIYSWVA